MVPPEPTIGLFSRSSYPSENRFWRALMGGSWSYELVPVSPPDITAKNSLQGLLLLEIVSIHPAKSSVVRQLIESSQLELWSRFLTTFP